MGASNRLEWQAVTEVKLLLSVTQDVALRQRLQDGTVLLIVDELGEGSLSGLRAQIRLQLPHLEGIVIA